MQWGSIKRNREELENITTEGSKFYDIGCTSEDVTLGEYLDRLPEGVKELNREGLVTYFPESGDNGIGIRCEPTVDAEKLLEKDSFEEAVQYRQRLLEYVNEEYS